MNGGDGGGRTGIDAFWTNSARLTLLATSLELLRSWVGSTRSKEGSRFSSLVQPQSERSSIRRGFVGGVGSLRELLHVSRVVGHVVLIRRLERPLCCLGSTGTLPGVVGRLELNQGRRGVHDPQHAVDVLCHGSPSTELV